MRAETLTTPDGAEIALRVWEPGRPARGNVVIGGAMGVRQDYYAAFAGWLAGQGWRVTTFDYRGSGASLPPGRSLRGFRADLFDWARDYEAVVDHAEAALPGVPLHLLGHSLGAQLPGLLCNQHKVSGMLSVAAGSGYWRENAPRLRRTIWYFWWVLVPVATRLCGYFPGRRLRKVGDLPAGVMLQWRRWCLDPKYSVGAEGEAVRRQYAAARFPLLALSFTDDELMTLRGTHSLVDLYENARCEVHRIAPADLAQRRIGHFGPFRTDQEHGLWPRMAEWLGSLARPEAA
ncbi:MAG TPA: alpha/beta fold hydrolase [Ramlibacter sp.]|jgi:predicted alpha/beta hydrolase|uniref:alpha/beta hydrolase family protein n=1 Tax=Ramlibacter sp. TaxID=1917967 RepID=UPI002D6EA068|nr:alpha/beta fold hydrolase [Ramlibacter sp.]HZY17493.1 alpha/beta fold hydrolase [Ramlibacter sp.]